MSDDAASSDGGEGTDRTVPGPPTDRDEREFGWQGWVLVAVLVVSLLVVPWTIVLLPPAQERLSSLGLGLRDAYLVLPMVPALALGAVAVWSALAAREGASARTDDRPD